MKITIQLLISLPLFNCFALTQTSSKNLSFIEKNVFKDKEISSKNEFEIKINSGSSFDIIQIEGLNELIANGAYLKITSINDGVIITAPIIRIKEKKIWNSKAPVWALNDSVINVYTILPVFYGKPMENRKVSLEIISYEGDNKWPVKIISSANDNLFLLKGLDYADEGTYDNFYNYITDVTEAYAGIFGLTIAEIKSMQLSEIPDYVRPVLLSINLLDSIFRKDKLLVLLELGDENSEDWKIFEAILSQIGLVKRYDEMASALKNEPYLDDNFFQFQPLIRKKGGPNSNSDYLFNNNITNNPANLIFFPPKTPEDLDQCMKFAIRTKVYDDGQEDWAFEAAMKLIEFGKLNPVGSPAFAAAEESIKFLMAANKLMNAILPSQLIKIEGEKVFTRHHHPVQKAYKQAYTKRP